MKHKIRNYIASRLGIRSQCEIGIELGRGISESFSKGIAKGYEGGRRMTNVNEQDIELKRFFKEMPKGVPPMQADILTEMYEMQLDLDYRIINERRVDKTVDEWVVGLTIAMESEIDEIRREVNWKWWKNPKEVDKDALQGEVIDMWHFLLSLSREVGMSPADIHQLYMEKNAENHARQNGDSDKDGYEVVIPYQEIDDEFNCKRCGQAIPPCTNYCDECKGDE